MFEKPVILTTRAGQKVAGVAREESLFGLDWLVLNVLDVDATRAAGHSVSFDVYFNPAEVASFAAVDGKFVWPFSENNPYRPASQHDLFEPGSPAAGHSPGHPPTPDDLQKLVEEALKQSGLGDKIGVGEVRVVPVGRPGRTAKRAAAPSEVAQANATFADHVANAPHDGCDCPACARARFEADGREFDKVTTPGRGAEDF